MRLHRDDVPHDVRLCANRSAFRLRPAWRRALQWALTNSILHPAWQTAQAAACSCTVSTLPSQGTSTCTPHRIVTESAFRTSCTTLGRLP